MRDFHEGDYRGRYKIRKGRSFPLIRISLLLLIILSAYKIFLAPSGELPPGTDEAAEPEVIAEASIPPAASKNEIDTPVQPLSVQPDPRLGALLMDVLRSQRPYGAFYLMVDGESGRILAWGQQERFRESATPSFLSNSEFPAASLVKIVTAATALESGRYSNHTLIPMIGSSVTLYRRQLKVPKRYNGPRVSLEKAFASSMNAPMGIVGMNLGGERMKTAARRLGFNRDFPSAMPARSSYAIPDSNIALAEAASGFTTEITLSPLLAAAVVRSVLKGQAPELPWSPGIGHPFAPARPHRLSSTPFKENTYYGLRKMFESTISRGSARGPFKNPRILYPYNRNRLRIGGKTGTKDQKDFRYEWFAGYMVDRKDVSRSLVLVCLHINELKGTRAKPPAQAAALLINHWAKHYLEW